MFLLFHLLVFYNLIIWKPCVSYPGEDTQIRMKGKLIKLAAELVLDAMAKIESVQHFKIQLHKSIHFQYGNLVYEMRTRHKKMFIIYNNVVQAVDTGKGTDELFVGAIADVDTLAHEILNFATMMQMHDANIQSDKMNPAYDLFFRRNDMAPIWLDLLESPNNNDNSDYTEPSTPPPSESNQTHPSKRKNGVWHYAIPIN